MMTKTTTKMGLVAGVLVGCFLAGSVALAVSNPQVQTNSASNIQSTSVTLNGSLIDLGGYGSATVWFQWGSDTSYGSNTPAITQNGTGNFSQQIAGLSGNQYYHYRAVAQNNYGTTYGQDMTFSTNQTSNSQITVNAGPNMYLASGQTAILQGSAYDSSGNSITYSWTCTGGTLSNYTIAQPTYTAPYSNQYNTQITYSCTLTARNNYGQSNSSSVIIYVGSGSNINYNNGQFTVVKNVRNLSSGNLNWSTYANAAPADVLQFQITAQNNSNQTVYNALIRDLLPASLLYYNNLIVNTNYSGSDITGGVTISSIAPGQTVTVTYQAQVASAANFSYGQTTLVNSASVSGSGMSSATASATIYVTKSGLLGATSVSTGLTNYFFTDSFFLPLVALLLAWWLLRSGIAKNTAHWLAVKLQKRVR